MNCEKPSRAFLLLDYAKAMRAFLRSHTPRKNSSSRPARCRFSIRYTGGVTGYFYFEVLNEGNERLQSEVARASTGSRDVEIRSSSVSLAICDALSQVGMSGTSSKVTLQLPLFERAVEYFMDVAKQVLAD
jgi:hypothetical protein